MEICVVCWFEGDDLNNVLKCITNKFILNSVLCC
jgi:hypothetical protein